MGDKELQDILVSHQKWLAGDGGKRANLTWANLTRANLIGCQHSNQPEILAELKRQEVNNG